MHILDNVHIWNLFRKSLDLIFGLYKKRMQIIRSFGIDRSVSILDVGCGTGQYSEITDGDYLGIDMDCRYIEKARKRFASQNKRFECVRLEEADLAGKTFNASLLIDLTHHIAQEDLQNLLAELAEVTTEYLVVSDPVKQSQGNYWGRFLTRFDRGEYIRSREEELKLIQENFEIVKIYPMKLLGIEGIMVFARPK